MLQVNIHEASSRLLQLVERALQGDCVIISLHGEPVIELLPVGLSSRQRKPGRLTRHISMAPDFHITSEKTIAEFEGQH